MKAPKIKHPGVTALRDYTRRIMSDGKWRNANDIVARAGDDGMVVSTKSAGQSLARLADDGYLDVDGDQQNRRMWRLAHREAAE